METIAVLGLGRMGQGIALRLIQSGFRVFVWNRNRAKAAPLLDAGAIWAESPAAAAIHTTVILAMVTDDTASETVWLGSEGALKDMRAGSFVIECSTLSAGHVKRLAAAAAERGLNYIDCPVTGLPEAAATGRLTLLVGAGKEALESVRPVLNSISTIIRHFGPVGAGTAYKLMINLMGTIQIAALAEGLAQAERLGLDREVVIAAIENSAAASPQVVRYTRRMAEKTFLDHPAFTVALRLKDATYGVSLAHSIGSPAPLGEAAASWFAKAGKMDAHRDEATVINVMI
jgi:3-hydroxyisobutyrate dehydrogenase